MLKIFIFLSFYLLGQIKTLPALVEKQTFAFFDWGEAEINRLIEDSAELVEPNIAWAHEAGQSAVLSPTPELIADNSQSFIF